MNKNRLEYHQPVPLASAQPIWPHALPPSGRRSARHGAEQRWVPGPSRRGWCPGGGEGADGASEASSGGVWTTLSFPMRDVRGDGNLLTGCPCQETKEERLKCQHLVGKKFLSGTFGRIPRGMQLEPLPAAWKGLGLRSQTARVCLLPALCGLPRELVEELNPCEPPHPHL